MFSAVRRIFSSIPPRVYALWAEIIIIISGIALVIFDLTFDPDPKLAPRFGDFYTYVALGGTLVIWSVYGVIATLKQSRKGVRIYLYGLVILSAIQIFLGILQIVLLFTLYRVRIIEDCFSIERNHFFWSSLGYTDADETKALASHCLEHWSKFVVQHTLTWCVFSIILVLATVLINRYYTSVLRAHRREIQMTTDWTDMENNKPITIMRGNVNAGLNGAQSNANVGPSSPSAPATEKLPLTAPPPAYWEIQQQEEQSGNVSSSQDNSRHDDPYQDYVHAQQKNGYSSYKKDGEDDDATMYHRRDRLYLEISKVRGHKQNQYLQSGSPTAPSTSGEGSIHPLDLRRKSTTVLTEQPRQLEEEDTYEYEYQPPSPRPIPRGSISGDPMQSSSEKMDYDLYRSRPHRLSVIHGEQSETITMSRRRNKPQWFQEEHQTLLADNDGAIDDTVNVSDGDSDYTDSCEYAVESPGSGDSDSDDNDNERTHLKD